MSVAISVPYEPSGGDGGGDDRGGGQKTSSSSYDVMSLPSLPQQMFPLFGAGDQTASTFLSRHQNVFGAGLGPQVEVRRRLPAAHAGDRSSGGSNFDRGEEAKQEDDEGKEAAGDRSKPAAFSRTMLANIPLADIFAEDGGEPGVRRGGVVKKRWRGRRLLSQHRFIELATRACRSWLFVVAVFAQATVLWGLVSENPIPQLEGVWPWPHIWVANWAMAMAFLGTCLCRYFRSGPHFREALGMFYAASTPAQRRRFNRRVRLAKWGTLGGAVAFGFMGGVALIVPMVLSGAAAESKVVLSILFIAPVGVPAMLFANFYGIFTVYVVVIAHDQVICNGRERIEHVSADLPGTPALLLLEFEHQRTLRGTLKRLSKTISPIVATLIYNFATAFFFGMFYFSRIRSVFTGGGDIMELAILVLFAMQTPFMVVALMGLLFFLSALQRRCRECFDVLNSLIISDRDLDSSGGECARLNVCFNLHNRLVQYIANTTFGYTFYGVLLTPKLCVKIMYVLIAGTAYVILKILVEDGSTAGDL